MSAKRYYYSDTINDFLSLNTNEIIGYLTVESQHNINDETIASWLQEINVLQRVLINYKERGSIYLEYNIPRMGKRVDAILLIDGVVFVLEFKTSYQQFSRSAILQVWDYALDLKNFHEASHDRVLIPVLVVPNENDERCRVTLRQHHDNVYEPILVNETQLSYLLTIVLKTIKYEKSSVIYDELWVKSGYAPTPTIIEAAIALYNNNTVKDITKHGGNIDRATENIRDIINHCRKYQRKAICFITGVPGAGKTLIGLNTAIELFNQGENAVYLSGNYPLVEVLQEALTRDYIQNEKQIAKAESRRACSKAEAKSRVRTFIQMIHHYRDLYLEGMEVKEGDLVPKEGYFQNYLNKAYVPVEHVAIFDEAQRAWTKEELQRFMREKKGFMEFPYSEPEYLISCMDRHQDWGVIICLIGNGQSINKGEAGIKEWITSLNRRYSNWEVYMSEQLVLSGDISKEEMKLIN